MVGGIRLPRVPGHENDLRVAEVGERGAVARRCASAGWAAPRSGDHHQRTKAGSVHGAEPIAVARSGPTVMSKSPPHRRRRPPARVADLLPDRSVRDPPPSLSWSVPGLRTVSQTLLPQRGRRTPSNLPAMSDRQFGFDTRAIHAGQRPDPETGPGHAHLRDHLFRFRGRPERRRPVRPAELRKHLTRIGNPTNAAFEERMASFEGGLGALATASGQAAQLIAILTLAQQGTRWWPGTCMEAPHPVRRDPPANGDRRHLHRLRRPPDPGGARPSPPTPRSLRRDHRQPGLRRSRSAAGADLANANGIPLVVDNTFATPYLCRPIEQGADIVDDSATKFIGGHGSSSAGSSSSRAGFPTTTAVSADHRAVPGLSRAEILGELP